MIENHRLSFGLGTLAITAIVLCLGFGIFADGALATLDFLLYPLGVFVMLAAIVVGVLVLGAFVAQKIRQ
jgi:hypothetical protein